MFEYACHEGNNAMKNMLSGARATERVNWQLRISNLAIYRNSANSSNCQLSNC